jgi:hypothetical protein
VIILSKFFLTFSISSDFKGSDLNGADDSIFQDHV